MGRFARVPGRRRLVGVALAAGIVVAAGGGFATFERLRGSEIPTYVPRDVTLRRADLFFYPSATDSVRAFVFFFGNDIGFWRAHRQLAADLASQGYAVVGFDMKSMINSLPGSRAERDSVFRSGIASLIARARREVVPDERARRVPLVLAGHSLGAEVALWAAADADLPDLAGVLALSPGNRSHLRATVADILMAEEPSGPLSFSVAETIGRVRTLLRGERIAIIRGSQDPLQSADSALLAAGSSSARRFVVALAGHSLKQVTLARFVVRDALAWILAGTPTSTGRQSTLSATRDRCEGPRAAVRPLEAPCAPPPPGARDVRGSRPGVAKRPVRAS